MRRRRPRDAAMKVGRAVSPVACETACRSPAGRTAVAVLRDIVKTGGAGVVLAGLSLSLERGSLTTVVARRGAGRSTLAAIVAGHRLADSGQVNVAGRVAPFVGHHGGFGVSGSVERDLALRAAACGVATRPYVRAVAACLGPVLGHGSRWLGSPFDALAPRSRLGLVHAAGWLMPADLYIADGPALPAEPRLAACLRPVLERARRRGAVLWLTAGMRELRHLHPDRLLLLDRGRLSPLADIEAAAAWMSGVDTPRAPAALPVLAPRGARAASQRSAPPRASAPSPALPGAVTKAAKEPALSHDPAPVLVLTEPLPPREGPQAPGPTSPSPVDPESGRVPPDETAARAQGRCLIATMRAGARRAALDRSGRGGPD